MVWARSLRSSSTGANCWSHVPRSRAVTTPNATVTAIATAASTVVDRTQPDPLDGEQAQPAWFEEQLQRHGPRRPLSPAAARADEEGDSRGRDSGTDQGDRQRLVRLVARRPHPSRTSPAAGWRARDRRTSRHGRGRGPTPRTPASSAAARARLLSSCSWAVPASLLCTKKTMRADDHDAAEQDEGHHSDEASMRQPGDLRLQQGQGVMGGPTFQDWEAHDASSSSAVIARKACSRSTCCGISQEG